MHVNKMKKADFEKVPQRTGFNSPVQDFYSLVIIPERHLHESGFRAMSFVAVDKNGEPIVRMSGYSDILNIDGIGGYGEYHGFLADSRPVQGWEIDCLKCGYTRIYCKGKLRAGADLSSFEIFCVSDEKGEKSE